MKPYVEQVCKTRLVGLVFPFVYLFWWAGRVDNNIQASPASHTDTWVAVCPSRMWGQTLGETGLGTICCSENKNFSKIYIPSKSQELCWCHYILEYLFTFGKNCQTGSWDCWNESMVIMYFLWKRGKKISELNKYSYWYFKKWCNRCSTYQSRGWYVWFLSSPKAQSMLRTPDTLWEMLSRPLIATYQENKTLKPEKNYHSTEMVISPDTDQHGSILCKTSL